MEYKLYKRIEEVQEQGKSIEQIKKEIYQLWQECFGDSDSYADFYFQWKVRDNQILTIYKERRICAMLHLNPYQIVMKGKSICSNYIVGVATRQQDRRQGLMKRLLEESLDQMYDIKMPFTYLMPAAEAIYSPFDFRIIYELAPWNQFLYETYQALSKQNLKANQDMEGKDYLVEILDESSQIEARIDNIDESSQIEARIDIIDESSQKKIEIVIMDENSNEDIDNLVHYSNELMSKRYDVYVNKTSYYFKRLLHEMKSTKGSLLVFYHGKQIVGYMAYMAEETIYITEAIYNEEWKKAIFTTILTEDKTVYEVMIQGGLKCHKAPTIMARIVHLEAFLQNMTAREDFKVTIQLNDPILSRNNGCFELHFTNMGCKVANTENPPNLSMTISELTKFCFGTLEEKELDIMISGKDHKTILNKLKSVNIFNRTFINDVV